METKEPIIGIDIGGTKMRGVLWNGSVIKSSESPTPDNKEDFLKAIREMAGALTGNQKIGRIGIGIAGNVSGTKFLGGPNLSHTENLDLADLLPEFQIRLDNDARCFARAEFLIGAGRGANRMLAFTIGTGIGRAYGENGKIKTLARFEPAESWEPEYQKIQKEGTDDEIAEFLGSSLSPIVKEFTPDIIVMGGGNMKREQFFGKLEAAFRRHGMTIPLVLSELKDYADPIGAALLWTEK
jgi:predicted NBD/HSP70 family sugar kinase